MSHEPNPSTDGPADQVGSQQPIRNGVLVFGSLVVDVGVRVATRDGRVLRLLPKQFSLLVYLVRNANRIVSRETIARDVWGDETATWTNVIAVTVNGLRNEIESDDAPTLLHTVRGQGYCLGELPQ